MDSALTAAAEAVVEFRQAGGKLQQLVGHNELSGILAMLGAALPRITLINLAPRLLDLARCLWLAGKR